MRWTNSFLVPLVKDMHWQHHSMPGLTHQQHPLNNVDDIFDLFDDANQNVLEIKIK